ncbi:MAG TPA: peptidylprolyl isomerase, partial [Chthonomonadales bacterium]|nr:peptidylprolyl isomerase [Chthonomonadales bacterium]
PPPIARRKRRRGAPRTPEMDRRFVTYMLLPSLALLAAGILVGILIVRQRHVAMDAIVSVNGAIVRADDVRHRLDVANGPKMLNDMVDELLWIQLAHSMKLDPTDKQIEARYDESLKNPATAATLKDNPLAARSLREQVEVLLAKEALLTQGVTVTPAEVARFYASNTNPNTAQHLYYVPDTAKVAIIETPDRSLAAAAIAQLRSGASFQDVAMKYSVLPNRAVGGIQSIERSGDPASPTAGLERAVFAMRIGDLIGPVSIGGPWVIIKCLDKTPGRQVPFSEVKADCEWKTRVQKGLALNNQRVEREFQKFKKRSVVDWADPRYKPTQTAPNTGSAGASGA